MTPRAVRPLLVVGALALFLIPLTGCDSGGANGGDDSESLSAPSNVSVSAQGDGSVALSWDAVGAADEYNVYRSTSTLDNASVSALTSVSSPDYTDNSASEGTTYYYYVTSVGSEGTESALSSSQKVTTASSPLAPSNFSASVQNDGTVDLSWDAADAADKYKVYRSTSTLDNTSSSALTSVSNTSYTDKKTSDGTTYYYYVTSVESGGDESGLSPAQKVTTPPKAPSNFSATAQSDGPVDLSWDAVSAADEYNVYRSTSTLDNASSAALANVSNTTYTDNSASEGTTYYYYVTSVGSEGNESTLSSSQKVTTASSPSDGGSSASWTLVKTATDNTINDVAVTSAGAYAVADGGILLKRTDSEWKTVLNDGPSSNGNDLTGLAVTDDGDRLWFVGTSGAIGEWDVTTGSLEQDHSAPDDVTNNFAAVTVTGQSGSANVQIADKSGKVLYSTDNGGSWAQVTPGSGTALRAIDTYGFKSGHLIDGNQSVFETTDGGGSWTKMGIADADVAFYGLDSDATDDVWVSGGNGTLYHWNGTSWSPTTIGEPDLRDLEVAGSDDNGYATGGSGAVFTYDGASWSSEDTPTSENLNAVVLGTSSTPPIAVGAGGTVIER